MRDCVIETWDPNEGPSFPKQFTFDSVYDQDSTTETIYNEICYPLVEVIFFVKSKRKNLLFEL